jgi:hypothetical protein
VRPSALDAAASASLFSQGSPTLQLIGAVFPALDDLLGGLRHRGSIFLKLSALTNRRSLIAPLVAAAAT